MNQITLRELLSRSSPNFMQNLKANKIYGCEIVAKVFQKAFFYLLFFFSKKFFRVSRDELWVTQI